MRCPKCGLTSFDYNEACPNCGRNLASIREELGLLDVAPQPLFLLGSLLGQKEPGPGQEEPEAEDFTFEPSEAEHLATYDGDSSGIQEEKVSVADMEEVATLEFEADLEEKEEGAGLEIQPEGEIEFEMPDEESSLSTEGAEVETPDQPLDLTIGEETLVLEPENPAFQLESEAETQIESSSEEIENLDLGLEPADEAEPLKVEDDDLDLTALDLEPDDLDLSDIELETEDAETSDFEDSDEISMVKQDDMEPELVIESDKEESLSLELNLDSAAEDEPLRTEEDELDLAALDLEPEDLDLSDIELETEDGETTGFGDSDEISMDKPDDLEPEQVIESVEEESLSLELNLDSAAEDEPLGTDEDELDLAALDLEPDDLDLSDIELETEDAETTGFGDSDETLIIEPEETPQADTLVGASETDTSPESEPLEALGQKDVEDLKGLGSMDLEMETEKETPGDEEEFDLPGLDIDQEDLLTTDEDELDDQALTASAEAELDDLESHLEDETLIIEDTDETLILENSAESESQIFQESEDEEDLDEIELDFDDLELELEEDI